MLTGKKNLYAYKSGKNRDLSARIRKTRQLIGDTQAQFARRLGISLNYVIAMENGQRVANERVAHAVFQATTIHPKWLLGKMGKKDQPINIVGVPITNREDARIGLEEKANPSEPITDEETLHMIEPLCSEVRAFLRAAMRRGRFFVARYYVREMIEKTGDLLRCRKLMDEEMRKKIVLPREAMRQLLEKEPRKKGDLVRAKLLRPLLVPPSALKRSSSSRRGRARSSNTVRPLSA